MTAQIYNTAASAASAMSLHPLLLIAVVAVPIAIVTGFAGHLAMLLEDLRYRRILSRDG